MSRPTKALYVPEHGKGWRLDLWQVGVVWARARAFDSADSPEAWLLDPLRETVKPGETADEVRRRVAAELGVPERDVAIEAWDGEEL